MAVLVTGDLGGPSHQYGPSNQCYIISFNGKRCRSTNSLVRQTTEQVRPFKTHLVGKHLLQARP